MNKNTPVFKFAIREDLKDSNIHFMPHKATDKATGWDVKVATDDHKELIIKPGEYVKIPLGFRVICEENWWLKLVPRSSTFAKKFCHCLYGVLDEDFFGQVHLGLQYLPALEFETDTNEIHTVNDETRIDSITRINAPDLTLSFGEAIGQIIPVKREDMIIEGISNQEFDELAKNKNYKRDAAGFGTTS